MSEGCGTPRRPSCLNEPSGSHLSFFVSVPAVSHYYDYYYYDYYCAYDYYYDGYLLLAFQSVSQSVSQSGQRLLSVCPAVRSVVVYVRR